MLNNYFTSGFTREHLDSLPNQKQIYLLKTDRSPELSDEFALQVESIMKDHILIRIENHSLLNNSQHCFTAGRSCLTNLLVYFEKVADWLDTGKPVDRPYHLPIDFAKI